MGLLLSSSRFEGSDPPPHDEFRLAANRRKNPEFEIVRSKVEKMNLDKCTADEVAVTSMDAIGMIDQTIKSFVYASRANWEIHFIKCDTVRPDGTSSRVFIEHAKETKLDLQDAILITTGLGDWQRHTIWMLLHNGLVASELLGNRKWIDLYPHVTVTGSPENNRHLLKKLFDHVRRYNVQTMDVFEVQCRKFVEEASELFLI